MLSSRIHIGRGSSRYSPLQQSFCFLLLLSSPSTWILPLDLICLYYPVFLVSYLKIQKRHCSAFKSSGLLVTGMTVIWEFGNKSKCYFFLSFIWLICCPQLFVPFIFYTQQLVAIGMEHIWMCATAFKFSLSASVLLQKQRIGQGLLDLSQSLSFRVVYKGIMKVMGMKPRKRKCWPNVRKESLTVKKRLDFGPDFQVKWQKPLHLKPFKPDWTKHSFCLDTQWLAKTCPTRPFPDQISLIKTYSKDSWQYYSINSA